MVTKIDKRRFIYQILILKRIHSARELDSVDTTKRKDYINYYEFRTFRFRTLNFRQKIKYFGQKFFTKCFSLFFYFSLFLVNLPQKPHNRF